MALLKCKMCGGSLEVSAGATIIECEYCGTRQTLPKTNDENIQSLFNRANLLRQKSEFDKAEAVYEKILEADDTEAEAYWGVILCKFGIEYVEDPKTYKRVPTCHRTSYDSIIADEYYKKALENADATQRAIYEAEAKKIDEIQKGILAIANGEEPYDVFICYKETDESGRRTQDSVIANDIYYQLTQEGFKVFYAAITLEDKLGSAYEPIIFAALNSSKVMLSIGTKPEYFDAVWVKNEWSRFLKMMKKDRSKMLIPCYRDMDAYDLPEEFAHLQAQDMGKIGFINDIVRGIKKVIAKDAPKATVVKETVVTSANPSVESLLKRVFMFLEDKEWDNANEYAEKVLDIDPENAEAYLGKLLVECRVRKVDELQHRGFAFDSSPYYNKAIRFGNEALVESLKKQLDAIKNSTHLKNKYDETVRLMKSAKTENDYRVAIERFQSLGRFAEAEANVNLCLKKIDDLKDADSEKSEKIYASAVKLALRFQDDFFDLDYRIKTFKEVIEKFEYLAEKEYKDSKNKLKEYKAYLANLEGQKVTKNGCYVATCVYGSYDCPQVWTLRRFRDDTLGSTWYGRAFIHTYYAISPTLVKWFGGTNWFKKMWRGTLDKMVNKLNSQGVEDTPYNDKEWRK